MATPDEYVARATAHVMRLLDEHGALVHPELEARIAEAGHADSPDNINPHHITRALNDLYTADRIHWDKSIARGGVPVVTIQPADRTGRATKIDKAAARKRLLFARYAGWATSGARYPRGRLGPAGEAAVRAALADSGQLQPAEPGFAEVGRLLGVPLNGPLDSAGYLVPLNSQGIPQPAVTVALEVKNIRSWIYPSSAELFQLLEKATTLQARHPNTPVLPVLVCRKAHQTTFYMAKKLGFIVIDMGRQYAGDIGEEALLPVRNELYFNDLHAGSALNLRVRDRFRSTLPRHAATFATTWSETCADPALASAISVLRRSRSTADREARMHDLRTAAAEQEKSGGW